MTQEEKELLLKDLCARLPYGNTEIKVTELTNDMMGEVFVGKHICSTIDIEDFILGKYIIRPYLRPMSSMTDEEKKEYHKQVDIDLNRTAEALREQLDTETYHPENRFTPQYCHIDWLNAHHFDYRGLIPMRLALPATEDMYKN